MSYEILLAAGATHVMPIEIDSVVKFIAWFHKTFPIVGLMLITVMLDIVFGLYAACVTRTLSSTISQKGMIGKAIQVTWVAFGAILEPYSAGMPMSGMVSTFFIVTNMISITENSARAGAPVPPVILEWLQRLRNNEKASVTQQPSQSTVNIQRASNVDIRTDGGSLHGDTTDANPRDSAVIIKTSEKLI